MKCHRCVLTTCLLLSVSCSLITSLAAPVGESVIAGSARFDRSLAGKLTINQNSDRVVINWRDFSVARGEVTKFVQPSSTAAALNRVVGGNPSEIYGSLQANGHIYLINPNGILVGPGGQVNTLGFVASTLNVSDASFMAGAGLTLSGNSTAGIKNEGSIQALGGSVFLSARTVENSGTIRAPKGTVGLAAASEVFLTHTGDRMSVLAGNVNAPQSDKGVNNAGTIEAAAAELRAAGGNIYALAINNGGVVRATSVSRENGKIVLKAEGGNIQNSGTLIARNADGGGGKITLDGGRNAAAPSTVINSGIIDARGDATGTKGGTVKMVGDHVGLFENAVVDVSGRVGGGTALIGGDLQGKNPNVQNAKATFVGRNAQIRADAIHRGRGGKVIVWSDETTRFYGGITARGGSSGGRGGFVETSGKDYLELIGAVVDAGIGGLWLLDPRDVTITANNNSNGSFDGGTPVNTFTPSGDDANVDRDTIQMSLDGGTSVTITTGGSGSQDGDITVNATITKTMGNAATLRLIAADDIVINQAIAGTATHPLTLDLQAAEDVEVNAAVTTFGGDFLSAGMDFDQSGAGTITTAGGAITLNHVATVTIDAALSSGGGAISLTGGGTSSVIVNSGITSGNADIAITGNGVDLAAPINSGTARTSLRTVGGTITLGAGTGGAMNLSQTELDNVTAAVLKIGDAGSGAITITDPININPIRVPVLSLESGGAISESGSPTPGTISAQSLAVRAGGAVTLDQLNSVGTLAASVSGNGNNFTYVDASGLVLGTVDGLPGVVNNNGNVTLTVAGNLTGGAATPDIVGNTITLTTSGGGTIGVDASTPLEINSATKLIATAGAALINVTETDGDLTLGAITTTGDFKATAANGSILDDGLSSLLAPANVTLTALGAGHNIGSAMNPLDIGGVLGGTMNLSAVGGGVHVSAVPAAPTDVEFVSSMPNGGSMDITTTFTQGARTFNVTYANSAAGNFTLSANGSILDNVTPITVLVPTATLTLRSTALNGSIGAAGAPDSPIFTQAGRLVLSGSGSGNIIVTESDGAILESATTGTGLIQFNNTLNNLVVGTVGTMGNINITTSAGSVLNDGSTATRIRSGGAAGTTTILSVENIGAPGNPLDVDGVAGGTVNLTAASGAVHLNTATAGDVQFISSSEGVGQVNTTFARVGGPTYNAIYGNGLQGDFTLVANGNILRGVLGNPLLAPLGRLTLSSTLAGGDIGALGDSLPVRAGSLSVNTLAANGDVFVTSDSINFAASMVNGNLTATATLGDITDSGAVAVTGNASFNTAAADADIVLDSGLNVNGTIGLNTTGADGDATIVNAAGIGFADSIIGGDLFARALAGNITDSGALAVDGNATFTAAGGSSIILDSLNTFNGTVAFNSSGGGNLNDVTVRDSTAFDLMALTIDGNLSVTAGGDITDSGTLIVNGDASFITRNSIAPGDIDLYTLPASSMFGSITARTLDDSGTTAVAGDIRISENGDMNLKGVETTADALFVASGNITDSGTLRVDGAATFATVNDAVRSITLNEVDSTFGRLRAFNLNAAGAAAVDGTISIFESGDMVIRDVLTLGNATFIASGNISDDPAGFFRSIGNDAAFVTRNNVARDIMLTQPWAFGTLTTSTLDALGNTTLGGTISVFEDSDLDLRQVDTTGNATFIATGNITDSGPLNIGGDATFLTRNDMARSITLDQPGMFGATFANSFGTLTARTLNGLGDTVVAGNISIFEMGNMNLTLIDTLGNASFQASGEIADSGVLTIGGDASFVTRNVSAQNINLDSLTSTFGSVTARTLNEAGDVALAGTIAVTESGAMDLRQVDTTAGATFIATADITDSGTLSIGGPASFTTSAGSSIFLNSVGNTFGGPVTFTAAGAGNLNNVTIFDTTAFDIGPLTLDGTLSVNAGGPITQSGNIFANALRASAAGSVTLNGDNDVNTLAGSASGAGNSFSFTDVDDVTIGTVAGAAGITTADGNVTLTADSLQIAQAVDSGGARTTLQPRTGGQQIHLGVAEVAGKLNLSDVELDLVRAGVLQIGNDTAGAIDISTAISPAGASALSLINNGSISGGGSISVPTLRVSAAGPVTFNNDNDVDILAATVLGAANAFNFRDTDGLNVGTVDGVTGITTVNGNVTLTADALGIAQAVDSGTARTILQPHTAGRSIDLGSETAGKLSLTDAELDLVNAGVLQIGNASAGSIDVSAALSQAARPALSLVSGGSISGVGSIAVPSLRLSSMGAITLNGNNDVANLAASIAGSGNAFSFEDVDDLSISAVDGVTGVTTANGALTLRANSLAINEAVNSGTARTTLQPRTAGRNIDLGSETAGRLSLTQAELDRVSAGVLQIGSGSAGSIDVSADISLTTPVLALSSGGSVEGSGGITVSELRIDAGGPVILQGNNDVDTLAAQVTGAGDGFAFNDNNALTIGTVDGLSGIETAGGDVSLGGGSLAIDQAVTSAGGNIIATAGTVAIGAAVNSGGGEITATAGTLDIAGPVNSGGGAVILSANRLEIAGSVNAGSGRVTLQPRGMNQSINLGPEFGGKLSLTADEVARVRAGTLQIGNTSVRAIDITAPLALADVSVLTLQSGGSIIESGAGSIMVDQLCLSAPMTGVTVDLAGANDVNVLAADGVPIRFRDINDLSRLAPVDLCGAGVPAGSDLLLFGGSVTVRVLSEQLASIAFVDIPTPRSASTSLGAETAIDSSLVAELVGPESIWTSSLHVPFAKEERKRPKVEEQSKWLSGHLAISGSTTGPQSPR